MGKAKKALWTRLKNLLTRDLFSIKLGFERRQAEPDAEPYYS